MSIKNITFYEFKEPWEVVKAADGNIRDAIERSLSDHQLSTDSSQMLDHRQKWKRISMRSVIGNAKIFLGIKIESVERFVVEISKREIEKVKVSKVFNSNTFQTASGKMIRLANVNAPEITEKSEKSATAELRKLVENKEVQIEVETVDDHGCDVALVSVGKKSVNKAMCEFLKKPSKKSPKKQ